MMDNMPEDKKKMMMSKMKEMMSQCMPKKVMDAGWSMTLKPNHMVTKYIVEYFNMPARANWVLTCIAAAKCWCQMKQDKCIEVEVRQNTMEQWPSRKPSTPHGFMPLMKECFKCPMSGDMKESEWMDETMDLCWRVIMNAGMVPNEEDAHAMGCSNVEEAMKKIHTASKKIYDCFDGCIDFLTNQERGVGSDTTME